MKWVSIKLFSEAVTLQRYKIFNAKLPPLVLVKGLYTTLANSVLGSVGGWQCVVLDHTDADVYGMIDGVHEVEIWRSGKKLIPAEWYT